MADSSRLWPCVLWLCASCSLDASPKSTSTEGNTGTRASDVMAKWKPEAVFEPRARIKTMVQAETDASASESARSSEMSAKAKAETPSGKEPDSDIEPPDPSEHGGASSVASDAAGSGDDATPQRQGAAGDGADAPVVAGGEGAAPVAGTQGSSMSEPSPGGAPGEPPQTMGGMEAAEEAVEMEAAAGEGGTSGDAGTDNLREALVEAAIEVFRERGRSGDSDPDRWRDGARSGGSLSPAFVLSILNPMRSTAVCLEATRRCVEACLVIAQDCEPCAADPECAEALADVCGAQIARCD